MALIAFGVYHSKSNRYNYSIVCKEAECIWKIESRLDNRVISFAKQDFLDAEMVRIDSKGEYVDTTKMKISEYAQLGHSIRMRLRVAPELGSRLKVEKYFIFMPFDMGRKTARSGVKSLMGFISDKDRDRFSYSRGRSVTVIGVLSAFFGLISLMLIVLFGRWKESIPRKLKKSS